MGSLMAGWDSPVPDPKAVMFMRNKSFTKEEIDAYWRTKKKTEEEHLKAISSAASSPTLITHQESESASKKEYSGAGGLQLLQRSSSAPLAGDSKERLMENISETETSSEKLLLKNGWWTRSNWAHLNEPPVIRPEGAADKYASQFHVAAGEANPGAGITA